MPSVSGNVGAVASVSSVFGRNGGVVAANGDYSGVVAAHLTGATAATRYVGGTASGAPVAGTFAVGDFVVAQSGAVWVCTVAGTPGTWVPLAIPVDVSLGGSQTLVRCAAIPNAGISAGTQDTPNLGGMILHVDSDDDGGAGVRLGDAGTADGIIQLNTATGIYAQPRSTASSGGTILEVTDKTGSDALVVENDGKLGFFGHAPAAQQTGVAVTTAAIHAALVALGLITA